VEYGARDRREAIRRLAELRRRLAAAEDALAGAQVAMKRAEGAFDAAGDRFGAAERALDTAREERAQARRARYAARQEHERAAAAADRLQRRAAELAARLDRMAELAGCTGRGVAVPAPDGRRVVGVAALPGHAAGGVVGEDHAFPARGTLRGVARPVVDPDYTATVGLARGEARALVAAADADRGRQALRTAAVVRLLLHNALRVDEACAADVADLGADAGHRVLRVTRKGARKAKIPLTPPTGAALDAYLAGRARRAGLASPAQLTGPLLATAGCGRLRQGHLWELARRLALTAGIDTWDRLSPHSLRHSAITFALDAGVTLRDVQDYAGHKDPRTTRRYDHSRDSLDRNAAYTVAAYLA
jgi:hypothetical protein